MKYRPLKITNARENNLKGISVEIEHDNFTVITGPSGSGKSSLAFDTVYAEGQRRYIETFSPYTRQFFDKVKKPLVDLVENVRPAIAIQQRTRVTNSRSTVGSITNINDYLKILWSNVAEAVCPVCDVPFEAWTAQSLAKQLIKIHELKGHPNFLICSPFLPALPEDKKKRAKILEHEIDRLKILGYSRYLNPLTFELEQFEEAPFPQLTSKGEILVVLDRLTKTSINQKRLADSIEQAFSLSRGTCLVIDSKEYEAGRKPFLQIVNNPAQKNIRAASASSVMEFRNSFACPSGNVTIEKAKPALFSYNHPKGACPECKGFGKILRVDPNLCVPDPSLSIKEKALACWAGPSASGAFSKLLKFCAAQKIPTNLSWRDLSDEQRDLIFSHKSRDYRGVKPFFDHLARKAYKMHVRVFLARYRGQFICPTCNGTRLRPDALAYRALGKTLAQLWELPISDLLAWMRELQAAIATKQKMPRQLRDTFNMVTSRLSCLVDLGVPYLTLDRQARTLSGGETQRVNLAASIGSELTSTHFVLDEPSVGLHPRDTERLNRAMRSLQQNGNSLLIVEHDTDCMAEADNIIEMGPHAGTSGGEVVYQGPGTKWSGLKILQAKQRTYANMVSGSLGDVPTLKIKNATSHNLSNLSCDIPLGHFVCLSGVSGSGKSTLVNEIIKKQWDLLQVKGENKSGENLVEGLEQFEQVLIVDQSPLARSPRANIATFSGMWDGVRDMLAATEDARLRALSKSAFSFNVDGGRCPACSGAGFVREDMQFLSDVYIPCDVCLGKRFQASVLEVTLRGKNVADLLDMSVSECSEFFANHKFIGTAAKILATLGLGHLTLGHPLSELSGGEAQRLKLVPFVQQSGQGKSLLVFDEPTTGLHVTDVERLIELLRTLVERGHSVLCIEHNLALLSASDWIIDLGPEGGAQGGRLMKAGTPKDFATDKKSDSYTVKYLREFLDPTLKEAAPKRKAKPSNSLESKFLTITGAREHNLKNIDVAVPLDQVVAITGVSGSGKSTIAKDIIYAEGQRRYLDCLSPYARQFIKELKKPDIDTISGIKPTICVYQHTFQPSSLSTVGTMSEIYNFLRLLYAKTSTQYCPDHPDSPISPLSAEAIAEEIGKIKAPTIRLLAPIIKMKKGNHQAVIARAMTSEIIEVRVDGQFGKPSNFEEGLTKSKIHSIDYTVAKFNPAKLDQELVFEAVQQALSLGAGTVIVHTESSEDILSTQRTCPICKTGFFKPDPEDLSFHSKRGRCSTCDGFGVVKDQICPDCQGARINNVGRHLRLRGAKTELNIHQASMLNAPKLAEFLSGLKFDSRAKAIAEPVLRELFSKTDTLTGIGLDYITLERDCLTLSNGELQRLRLATSMGSPLSGVLYIYDEPSAGLHPNDNKRVLARFQSLKERGNSVILIDHDSDTILSSDYVIDVGPGGGKNGGTIVYAGPTDELLESDCQSATAEALRNSVALPISPTEKAPTSKSSPKQDCLTIKKSSANNIKDLSLDIPLGCLVTVAGVSGAGKSSVVHSIIAQTISEGKRTSNKWKLGENSIESTLDIARMLFVDQKPIGKNSRSTPASYLGIWDDIRKLYAGTIEAKARGWTASYFSYNTGKGRCPECKGQGYIKLEMNFLADAEMTCETCLGKRFSDEADSVHYLDHSISQILNLTFDEARILLKNHRTIHQVLHQACELGLGYLTLGQGSGTLSGGESQRIKLVSELSAPRKGHTLYILDEPTTGLHKLDVSRLVKILKALASRGNSVIVIEHDPDVVIQSDYVVELGPGPGAAGGQVIYAGPPSKLPGANTPWGVILGESGVVAPTKAIRLSSKNVASL